MMIAKRLMKQIPAESIEKELEEAQKVLALRYRTVRKRRSVWCLEVLSALLPEAGNRQDNGFKSHFVYP